MSPGAAGDTAPGGGLPRIAAAFARARAEGRAALVLYLTAGDPDFETSLRCLLGAARAGVDVLELGVPWSDPSADGLAIQGAMARALAAGGGLSRTLELCARLRAERPELPVILFGYANPIAVLGPAEFARRARAAGADGALCVDWPADEDPALAEALRAEGLACVPLLAPTSGPERIAAAARLGSGFIYYVSLTGITGAALANVEDVAGKVRHIRDTTGAELPVVVGFGIKSAPEARALAPAADGVVVGSAAVRVVEQAHAAGRPPEADLAAFVDGLRGGLNGGG